MVQSDINNCIEDLVPFDHPGKLGFFKSLYLTIVRVLFSPKKFFSSLPPQGTLIFPLILAILCVELGVYPTLIFIYFTDPWLQEFPRGIEGMLLVLVVSIILLLGFLLLSFVQMALFHWIMRMRKDATQSFRATLRAYFYCAPVALFGLVPLVGGIIVSIWNLILLNYAQHKIHSAHLGRVLSSFIISFFLLALIGFSVIFSIGFIRSRLTG